MLPGVAEAGPVLLIERSALPTTGVDDVDELLPATGSAVVDDTVAVFRIGLGVVYEAGTEYVLVIVRVAPTRHVWLAQFI